MNVFTQKFGYQTIADGAGFIRRHVAQLFNSMSGQPIRRLREESERQRRENDHLRRHMKRLSDFLDASSDVVWEVDSNLTLLSSDGDQPFPGGGIGRKLADAVGANPDIELHWGTHLRQIDNCQPFRGFEFSFRRPDGPIVWLEANGNPTFLRGQFNGYRGTYRDITQRRSDEARIAFLANHDPLTSLANRTRFRDLTGQALARLADSDLFRPGIPT